MKKLVIFFTILLAILPELGFGDIVLTDLPPGTVIQGINAPDEHIIVAGESIEIKDCIGKTWSIVAPRSKFTRLTAFQQGSTKEGFWFGGCDGSTATDIQVFSSYGVGNDGIQIAPKAGNIGYVRPFGWPGAEPPSFVVPEPKEGWRYVDGEYQGKRIVFGYDRASMANGFTLKDAKVYGSGQAGVFVIASRNVVIDGLYTDECRDAGVSAEWAESLVVRNSTFRNSKLRKTFLDGGSMIANAGFDIQVVSNKFLDGTHARNQTRYHPQEDILYRGNVFTGGDIYFKGGQGPIWNARVKVENNTGIGTLILGGNVAVKGNEAKEIVVPGKLPVPEIVNLP